MHVHDVLFLFTAEPADSGIPQGKQPGQSISGDTGPIRAPAPMWRCSKIMHMQRELHPTILNSLEGIVDQVNLLFKFLINGDLD